MVNQTVDVVGMYDVDNQEEVHNVEGQRSRNNSSKVVTLKVLSPVPTPAESICEAPPSVENSKALTTFDNRSQYISIAQISEEKSELDLDNEMLLNNADKPKTIFVKDEREVSKVGLTISGTPYE